MAGSHSWGSLGIKSSPAVSPRLTGWGKVQGMPQIESLMFTMGPFTM